MKTIFSWLRKHPKRNLAIAIIIILIFLLIRHSQSSSQPQYQYMNVKPTDISSEVSTSGVLTGQNSATLQFKMPGKLSYLNVKNGDRVTSGEIIAGLDTQDLNIALKEAQNTLSADQAALQKTLDDIHLFQYGNGGFSNVGSANETETQRAERTSAQETVNNAQEAVNSAEQAFQDAVLVSPIAGVVTQVGPVAGENIGVADTIAKVVDFSQIIFAADVDESDITSIKVGQPAQVTLNAYGDKIFQGFVSEIEPVTKTSSNGATVVTVKIQLINQSIDKIDGLNGQVNIITNQRHDVLVAPQDAVRDDSTVLVKTGSGFKVVKVTTGIESDTDVEITSGLHPGDVIITNPPPPDKTPASSNKRILGIFG